MSVMLALYELFRSLKYVKADFAVYRIGGSTVLHHHALYGAIKSAPFTYPPFSALVFIPWSVISWQNAQFLWTALTLACLAGFIWQAVCYATPALPLRARVVTTFLALGLALLLRPIRENFELGQINIILAFVILLDLRKRTGIIPSGVFIGIAAAIKLTPLLFIPYLFLANRKKGAITAIGTFFMCTALGAFVTWQSSVQYWTRLVWNPHRVTAGNQGPAFVTNQSLYGFWSRVIQQSDYATLVYLSTGLLVLAAGLGLAVLARRSGHHMIGDILCACTILLLSPISWTHHWVWIIAAMLWLAIGEDAPHWGKPVAAVGFLLFVTAPIYWVLDNHWTVWQNIFMGGDVLISRTGSHLSGWQLVTGNSYVLAAVIFMTAVAYYLLAPSHSDSGRRRQGRLSASKETEIAG